MSSVRTAAAAAATSENIARFTSSSASCDICLRDTGRCLSIGMGVLGEEVGGGQKSTALKAKERKLL